MTLEETLNGKGEEPFNKFEFVNFENSINSENNEKKFYAPLYSSLQDAVNKSPLIADCYRFSKIAHGEDLRESGENYFHAHIEYVTNIVIDNLKYLNPVQQDEAIAGALLHDVKEDGKRSKPLIKEYIDETHRVHVSYIAGILDKKDYELAEETALSVGETNKVIGLILCADKVHNLNTLGYKKSEDRKQEYLADVTRYIKIAKEHGFTELELELSKPWVEYLKSENFPLKGEGLKNYSPVKITMDTL